MTKLWDVPRESSDTSDRPTFVDLFAGIGGFHAALSAVGGECVFVSEIDEAAREIYERNWGHSVRRAHPNSPRVVGDINLFVPQHETSAVKIPAHDILAAGFPCQPFSKSGAQQGTRDRTRGTLFHNILRALEERRPKIVMLENVRNLAGPRHRETWTTIIAALRDIGYRVSSTPTVFSPHFLPPSLGGTPQVRERVFILGVYVGRRRAHEDVSPPVARGPVQDWNPLDWDIERTILPWLGTPLLIDDREIANLEAYRLRGHELDWVNAWDDFVARLLEAREGQQLPGFPLWVDDWVHIDDLWLDPDLPKWKRDILLKNAQFYTAHQSTIDGWLKDWDYLEDFPSSRRKFEWQAQGESSLFDTILHFRPSGVRAKRPTYFPALVAINQTSIIGGRSRRITPREAARLQGFPDWFSFGEQPDALSYKQLGNGVSIGAVHYLLREFIRQNLDLIPQERLRAIADAPDIPRVPEASGTKATITELKSRPLSLTL